MDFQIKVLLISFFVTVAIAVIVVPILRKLKVGQIERSDGPQSHLNKKGTPTMGGIIIAIAIIALTAFIYIYYSKTQPEVAKRMLPLALASIGFGFIGFLDDFKKLVLKNTKGLKPSIKMLGLLVISIGFTFYSMKFLNIGTDTYIPFFKTFVTLPIWLYIPFSIFVMLATTNAVNLTDGIDGLSSSIVTIIMTTLAVIGIVFDIKEVAIFGSIVAGSCLGFLLFNLNPAKVFMGDTGSLLLGGAIAVVSLYLKMPLIILIIGLIPVIETLSVAIQVLHYKRTGNRIFKMAPIHHHFELCGWKENKIVSIFSVVTLVLCIIGVNAI